MNDSAQNLTAIVVATIGYQRVCAGERNHPNDIS